MDNELCIDTVAPSGDQCFTDTEAPSSDIYCTDIVVPSSDHCNNEIVPPSGYHYCTMKVAPPTDHSHPKRTKQRQLIGEKNHNIRKLSFSSTHHYRME